jgi:hypothetical protein
MPIAPALTVSNRNSIGKALRCIAYLSKNATPKNKIMTPALTTTLPVVKKLLTNEMRLLIEVVLLLST